MAEQATLARPYANAVFGIAKREKRLDAWSRSLAMLSAAVSAPKIREVLAAPATTAEEKAHRLTELLRDELDQRGRRFVGVLARNKRLELLPEIATQYEALRAEQEKTLEVEVISALTLTEEDQQRLTDALAKRYEREVQLTARVDENLIGGAIVRAGDTVIDGSVRGKLEKLSETLLRV
jgi:F-type H+-transporting ATPase subunit delta